MCSPWKYKESSASLSPFRFLVSLCHACCVPGQWCIVEQPSYLSSLCFNCVCVCVHPFFRRPLQCYRPQRVKSFLCLLVCKPQCVSLCSFPSKWKWLFSLLAHDSRVNSFLGSRRWDSRSSSELWVSGCTWHMVGNRGEFSHTGAWNHPFHKQPRTDKGSLCHTFFRNQSWGPMEDSERTSGHSNAFSIAGNLHENSALNQEEGGWPRTKQKRLGLDSEDVSRNTVCLATTL